jgi:outer membrane protein OmpA-like peptidoglycan-associated protein
LAQGLGGLAVGVGAALPEGEAKEALALSELTVDEVRRGVIIRVAVQGYAASECAAEMELLPDLAIERARVVAARLIELGIPADRVEPRADNPTSLPNPTHPDACGPEAFNRSRRAEIEVLRCR